MNKSIKHIIYGGNKKVQNKTRKKNNISSKPSIKDDAFNHFNYGWINNTKIPKSKTKTNLYSILQEDINRYLIRMIESFETSRKNEEINCWNLYCSYIKKDNALIKLYIKNEYEHLCNILDSNDITELYKFFTFKNIELPFEWHVQQDSRNVSNYTNYIYDNGLTLIDKKYYTEYKNKEKIEQYKLFLNNIFEYIFGKNHRFDVDSIINVEKEFAKNTPDEWERQNSDMNYYKLNINELKKIGFNWERYSNSIGFKNTPDFVILNNRKYFEHMFNYVNKNWDTPVMRTYWIFKLLLSFSTLESELKKMNFNFFDSYLHDQKIQTPIKKSAMYFVSNCMNTYISKKFLQENCNKKSKYNIEKLSREIISTFKTRINKNTWLSKKTKEHAIEKINNVKVFVGYKNEFLKDPNIEFRKDDIYFNIIENTKFEINTMISCYYKKYDKNIWDRYETGNVYDVNAFYNPLNNEIILPCGILRYPFIVNNNFEYTLAFLGCTIGHELTHGFDDDGSKYDKKGNYINWWNKLDKEKYNEKQKSIMNLYNRILKDDNYNINSKLSLGENLADNGGLIICEDLLLEKIKFKNDKEKSNILKRFYKFYCHQWKDKMKRKAKIEQMNTDEHLFSKYRCNGSLMNSELFSNTYDIKKGDMMYNDKYTNIW